MAEAAGGRRRRGPTPIHASARSPFAPLATEEAAANRVLAAARESQRREAHAARAALAAEMPWLDGGPFPEAAVWRPVVRLVVQPTGPLHAWYWGGAVPDDGHHPWAVPAGAALGPPSLELHGPPAGAYACSAAPDDGSDDEPWWQFRLPSAIGALGAGAVIESGRDTASS